jgi:hypothetical protein
VGILRSTFGRTITEIGEVAPGSVARREMP